MARHVPRHQRVADQIQRELAQLIRDEVRDTRLGMLTLTAVRVSPDLSHAKVFFTTMDPEQKTVALEVLGGAAPHLRSLLGRLMRLRITPQLHFVYDESIERGAHMSAVISAALARDAALRGEEAGEGKEATGDDDSEGRA
ncbi:30S ribosome-binding factor RbfA [Thiofaba sp. EF100]|uniref:30S ribosome-binding factor RbfA n=1 Tax=Thiofaba sp. EF100 TaxID=3121274 RepID=UPI00322221AB